jgi:hypothetical protein
VQALTRKVNLSDMMDGIDLDDDDLSSFFCSEHTAEALKRAALNHSGEGPYGAKRNVSFFVPILQRQARDEHGKR